MYTFISLHCSCVIHYPLFYNEEILVNKKSIFNATCFEAGVFYVSDLMESTDKFMSHETFCSNFKIKINFLEFHGMVGAAKNFLKNNEIKDKNCSSNFNIRPIMPPLIDIILRNTTGAKPFYNLINSNDDFPTSQTSWEKKFLQKFDAAERQNIYSLPFILSQNSNLQWFQYRLNHRIIGTNDLLFQMNITTDNKCTFCKNEVENIIHLFWECKISQNLIIEIFSNVFNNQKLTVTKKEFIFGKVKDTDMIENALILFVKMFLYSCKMQECIPTFRYAKLYLRYQYKIHLDVLRMFAPFVSFFSNIQIVFILSI